MKRPAALLLPVMLALAACGGDDAGDATDDASDRDGSVEAWCGVAQELSDLSDGVEEVDPFDPAAIEEAYGDLRSTAEGARSAAPAEIRSDVELLVDGVVQIDDALAAADYNFLDVDLAFMENLGDDVDDASDRLDDFNVRECGFDPDDDIDVGGDPAADDDSGDDFDPAAGPVRDQLVDELVATGFTSEEAECVIDNIDMTDVASDPEDPAAMFEVFEVCDISLERLLQPDD